MKRWEKIGRYLREFGRREVPVWYESSTGIVRDFQTVGRRLKFLKIIPNRYPFYDWIMGFYERWSNLAAMRGPVLERVSTILDAGVGTGYLLSRVVRKTGEGQKVIALDLSRQMLENARGYLRRKGLESDRVGVVRANCTGLPHEDGSIDLYISSYLFDLLSGEEIECAIGEMERVLGPDGHAILVTMTTELDDVWLPFRLFYRFTNELYCFGYTGGRWNRIWRFLCSDYAPHCRPIALGSYLRRFQSLAIEYTKLSRVSLFPVRIYYIRKSHG